MKKSLLLAGHAKRLVNHAKRVVNFAAVVFAFAQMALAAPPMTMYVATNGTGQGTNGWTDATNSIQGAIDMISNSPVSIVWVSNGVYVLTNQVTVAKAINIYGYPNGSLPVIDGNNSNRCLYITANSVLSNLFITRGYTNGNGGGANFTAGGNVYNCVFSNNYATNGGGMYGGTQILDCAFIANMATNSTGSGSTFYGGGCGGGLYPGNARVANCTFQTNIAGGYYDGGNYVPHGGGGGLYLSTFQSVANCQFIGNVAYLGGGLCGRGDGNIINCTIVSNIATYLGGGAVIYSASCILSNSFISNNIADAAGGGILATVGYVKNCIIACNRSLKGGGIYAANGGAPAAIIINCIIEGNVAVYNGADGGGGGIYDDCGSKHLLVQNCLIRHNVTSGSIYNLYGGGGIFTRSWLTYVSSCTIVSNYSDKGGGGISACTGSQLLQVDNSIIYFNQSGTASLSNYYNASGSYSNCCSAPALSPGPNNITANPQFVDWTSGNYRLSQGSPCINAGANTFVTTNMPTDLDGHSRIDHYSGIVDMGCYEYLLSGTMVTIP
jgi:hypothetical protein